MIFRHTPGQRHPSNYYQQPNQQARPPHPNYNNIQQSGEAYHQQKPYPSMPPPRMPMTGPPQRRMPVPAPQPNYRSHPPSSVAPSHPGYRPTSVPPSSGYYSNSSMAPGFQTSGAYKQTPHHEEVVKKVRRMCLASRVSVAIETKVHKSVINEVLIQTAGASKSLGRLEIAAEITDTDKTGAEKC